jgi:putative Ca2+/H+ antiporter (TMEM165/GDT1 family)
MDWKLFAATFTSIFLAEKGDKTQLATMSLASAGSRWTVFAAAASALVATSLVAVLVGEGLTRVVSPLWLKRGAGAVMLVMGLLFLFGKGD